MASAAQLTRRRLLSGAGAAVAGPARRVPAAAPAAPTLVASQFGTVGDGSADDSRALETALIAAFGATSGVLMIPPGIYRIGRTIRVPLTAGGEGRCGVMAHGAHIVSTIGDGSNVFEFVNRADARYVVIEGLDILGSHRDGHGLYIESESPHAFADFCLRDVVVQYCGGDGAHLVGNLTAGQVSNGYFRTNRGNGITLSNGQRAGGVLSAVHVFGCVFGDNGQSGAALVNRCNDVAFHGCYFLQNGTGGLTAENGCTLLSNCGFENNHQTAARFEDGNAGIHVKNFATLIACMGYSMLKQSQLIHAELNGPLVMVGCSGSGDAAAKAAGLARLGGTEIASATLIGCSGAVSYENGFEGLEIAGAGGGIKFGADWRSRILPRFGDYRLWVDRGGRLRMKKGMPSADNDGVIVGT